MSYQNVATPRFYVSILQWLDSLGKLTAHPSGWIGAQMSPVSISPEDQHEFSWYYGNDLHHTFYSQAGKFNTIMPDEKNFFMLLGHTFSGVRVNPIPTENYSMEGIVNHNPSGSYLSPEYDGFSISIGNGAHSINTNEFKVTFSDFVPNSVYKIGSVLYGTYYDMPNAPNLSLTMSREYGGTKEFTTYNGSSMSNTMWSKPPKWGDLGAWELGGGVYSDTGNPQLSKSGRRTWNLKFSSMDNGDLWGSNQSMGSEAYTTTGYDSGDLDDSNNFEYNILTDDSFFSQVWHKTLGMTLPMIFQPDSSNNNPDQFAIVKGVPNSLKATQSAPNTYDISISLEEAW